MKRKFSLIIKFILLAILFISLITTALILSIESDSRSFIGTATEKQIELYIDLFDVYFGDYSKLENNNSIDTLNSFVEKNNDTIVRLDILLFRKNMDEEYELFIALSSDEARIGTQPNNTILNHNKIIYDINKTRTYEMFRKRILKTNNYLIIEPIISEEEKGVIGTYEMVINFDKEVIKIQIFIFNTITLSIFALILLIASLFFIIYVFIQKPLSILKDATIKLGKEQFDTKVDIKSKDEFGDLANTFNKMAEDLKISRDKIEEYNRILEKLLDQKDEFIGQLGHDLKNPMQPLVGLLPILLEKETDPDNREMLEVMNTNVEYMQDLIFDTLKLAKLRSDNIDFNYENLDLKTETEKVVKSQKPMLEEKNIKIINNIKSGLKVYADKLRLAEIFKNLINNSVKYTKDSGGTITIDAEIRENDFVQISLKDTGIGMTDEQLKKVFDEFYKADRQTSDYHSTGLGLAIVKRIVEKHGGKIWVESMGIDMGSTFYFTIKKSGGVKVEDKI